MSAGAVDADTLQTLTIKGSISGGGAIYAGSVGVGASAGVIAVGGSLYGGDGQASGAIIAGGIEKVTVGGSIYGGKGPSSAEIYAVTTGIDLLKIRGDVRGRSGTTSGKVTTGGQLDKQMIGGLVIPGTGANSGTVS